MTVQQLENGRFFHMIKATRVTFSIYGFLEELYFCINFILFIELWILVLRSWVCQVKLHQNRVLGERQVCDLLLRKAFNSSVLLIALLIWYVAGCCSLDVLKMRKS